MITRCVDVTVNQTQFSDFPIVDDGQKEKFYLVGYVEDTAANTNAKISYLELKEDITNEINEENENALSGFVMPVSQINSSSLPVSTCPKCSTLGSACGLYVREGIYRVIEINNSVNDNLLNFAITDEEDGSTVLPVNHEHNAFKVGQEQWLLLKNLPAKLKVYSLGTCSMIYDGDFYTSANTPDDLNQKVDVLVKFVSISNPNIQVSEGVYHIMEPAFVYVRNTNATGLGMKEFSPYKVYTDLNRTKVSIDELDAKVDAEIEATAPIKEKVLNVILANDDVEFADKTRDLTDFEKSRTVVLKPKGTAYEEYIWASFADEGNGRWEILGSFQATPAKPVIATQIDDAGNSKNGSVKLVYKFTLDNLNDFIISGDESKPKEGIAVHPLVICQLEKRLQAEIDTITGDNTGSSIASLQTDVDNIKINLAATDAKVETNTQSIEELKNRADAGDTSTEEINEHLTTLDEAVAANKQAIADANTKIEANHAEYTEKVSQIDSSISTINDHLTTLDGSVATNTQAIADANTKINSNYTELDERLDDLYTELDITTQGSEITSNVIKGMQDDIALCATKEELSNQAATNAATYLSKEDARDNYVTRMYLQELRYLTKAEGDASYATKENVMTYYVQKTDFESRLANYTLSTTTTDLQNQLNDVKDELNDYARKDTEIATINSEIATIKANATADSAALTEAVDTLNARITDTNASLTTSIGNVDTKVTELKASTETSISAIEGNVTTHDQKIQDLENNLQITNTNIDNLKTEHAALIKENSDNITALQEDVDKLLANALTPTYTFVYRAVSPDTITDVEDGTKVTIDATKIMAAKQVSVAEYEAYVTAVYAKDVIDDTTPYVNVLPNCSISYYSSMGEQIELYAPAGIKAMKIIVTFVHIANDNAII